jgi:hypothetical protein
MNVADSGNYGDGNFGELKRFTSVVNAETRFGDLND